MAAHVLSVSKKPVCWALVADGKQARIFVCRRAAQTMPIGGDDRHPPYHEKSGYELKPVLNGILNAKSISDYQLGHEQNILASNGNNSAHTSHVPHGDIKAERKHDFTKAITVKLQQAHTERLFDRLVLVAPAKMIGELRNQLSAELQHCIAAVLPRDLAHFQGEELLHHLQDTLIEAHVA